jgi:hypothetical protein
MRLKPAMFFYKPLPTSIQIKFFNTRRLACFKNKNKVYLFYVTCNTFMILVRGYLIFCMLFFNHTKFLYFCLLNFGLRGLFRSWYAKIELIGVGFRVIKFSGGLICIKLGYSHLVSYAVPKSVFLAVSIKRSNRIVLKGRYKPELYRAVSILRRLRQPDVYKAKGVRIKNEILNLKKREKWGVF